MKTIPKISTSLLIVSAALALSACGGGDSPAPIRDASDTGNSSDTGNGNGNGNGNGTSTIQKLTGVNGLKIDYRGVWSDPGSTWQGSIVDPVKYTSITTVNAFTLTDSAVPGHFDTFVLNNLSGESLFIQQGGSRVGGATYSRFGWLYGESPIATNTPTTWRTPFAFASSTPASPTDATYAGTNQALLYL